MKYSLAAMFAVAFAIVSAPAVPPQAYSAPELHGTPPSGDSHRGEAIYEAKCGACHSLDANRIGPKHRGVYGREAGSVPDFSYTAALKNSHIVWNAQTLDRWLQSPTAMVPGTAMGFQLSSAQERADVIAYLREESQAGKPAAQP